MIKKVLNTTLGVCCGLETLYVVYFWIVAGGDWKTYIPLTDWRQVAFMVVASVYQLLYVAKLGEYLTQREWPDLDFRLMFFVANIIILWIYASVM